MKNRPKQIHDLMENKVDFKRGVIFFDRHETTQHIGPKQVALLPEDPGEISRLPRQEEGQNLNLFRWDVGAGLRYKFEPLGKNLLATYWKQACKNLGIEGVDLYGGDTTQ